jgi:hypothetical protein
MAQKKDKLTKKINKSNKYFKFFFNNVKNNTSKYNRIGKKGCFFNNIGKNGYGRKKYFRSRI